jgi:hypothetical protein
MYKLILLRQESLGLERGSYLVCVDKLLMAIVGWKKKIKLELLHVLQYSLATVRHYASIWSPLLRRCNDTTAGQDYWKVGLIGLTTLHLGMGTGQWICDSPIIPIKREDMDGLNDCDVNPRKPLNPLINVSLPKPHHCIVWCDPTMFCSGLYESK